MASVEHPAGSFDFGGLADGKIRPAACRAVCPLSLCLGRSRRAEPSGQTAAKVSGLEPAGFICAFAPAGFRPARQRAGPAGLCRRRAAALPGSELERPAGQSPGCFGPTGAVFRPHPHPGSTSGNGDRGERRGQFVSVAQRSGALCPGQSGTGGRGEGHGSALFSGCAGHLCYGHLSAHSGLPLSAQPVCPAPGRGRAPVFEPASRHGSGGLRRLCKGGISAVGGGVFYSAGGLSPNPSAIRPPAGPGPGGNGLYSHHRGRNRDGSLGVCGPVYRRSALGRGTDGYLGGHCSVPAGDGT